MRKTLTIHLFLVFCKVQAQQPKLLSLKLLSNFDSTQCAVCYLKADVGKGNTSIEFDSKIVIKTSDKRFGSSDGFGYFTPEGKEVAYVKRNRDLGQTFRYNGKEKAKIKAITVRTGWGTNAVRGGMYGQKLSIQWFEVNGNGKLNKNGTDTTEALHGWPHDRVDKYINPDRDDFIEGETYRSAALYSGATFPTKIDFGFTPADSVQPDHEKNKGRYLQFSFDESATATLEPGKQYAFLIMIDSIGQNRAFALANNFYGSYPEGHGIRRDGDGTFPPKALDLSLPLEHPVNKSAIKSAKFPTDLKKRMQISPGTNGYPDVDTWRDLWFCIEVR